MDTIDMKSGILAILMLGFAVAACDSPCHEGVWERVEGGTDCSECTGVSYLKLDGDGSLLIMPGAFECDVDGQHTVFSTLLDGDTYAVDGSTITLHPESDSPAPTTITCEGDTLSIGSGWGSSEGGGDWVRAGDEVEALFDVDCSSWDACHGPDFPGDQCQDDEDCPYFDSVGAYAECYESDCEYSPCW